jgi:hypothetical protein
METAPALPDQSLAWFLEPCTAAPQGDSSKPSSDIRAIVPPYKVLETTQAIDRAVRVLFPFTDFAEVSFDLFIKLAEGKLTFEEEQMLHALGIEF